MLVFNACEDLKSVSTPVLEEIHNELFQIGRPDLSDKISKVTMTTRKIEEDDAQKIALGSLKRLYQKCNEYYGQPQNEMFIGNIHNLKEKFPLAFPSDVVQETYLRILNSNEYVKERLRIVRDLTEVLCTKGTVDEFVREGLKTHYSQIGIGYDPDVDVIKGIIRCTEVTLMRELFKRVYSIKLETKISHLNTLIDGTGIRPKFSSDEIRICPQSIIN